MTPLQLTQMKASGGINKLAAEHIEYQQGMIDKAAKCMKEKQETIDKQSEFIYNIRAANAFDDYGSKFNNIQKHINNWEKNNPKNLITWMK